ncbi:UNVERIFIED_CONTAM: Alkaline phosphatase, tissue-nonspecific isozyme [Trichonephila clavipes]
MNRSHLYFYACYSSMEIYHFSVKTEFRQDSTFPMLYETHGAEDVPVYANGPWAHLFHGVHDQSYIPYAMGYAACIGPNQDACSGALSILMSQGTTLKLIIIALATYFSGRTAF